MSFAKQSPLVRTLMSWRKRWPRSIMLCFSEVRESVEILLQAGAAPDAPNEVEDRITPLANAANRAHVDIVKLLLDAGANVNSTEPGGSALMRAAGKESRDHLRIVQMLIAAGADVNGDQGRLLTRACMTGSLDNIKALVEAGADVNRSSLIATPLIKAIEFNRAPVVEFLLAGGADPSISAPEKYLNFPQDGGKTPLEIATRRGLSASLQLIQNRIDTTTSRRSRRTKKSDSPSESLESYWHRITEHFSEIAKAGDLKLLGPAYDEEIEVVERLCGLTLPEDFKVGLSRSQWPIRTCHAPHRSIGYAPFWLCVSISRADSGAMEPVQQIS